MGSEMNSETALVFPERVVVPGSDESTGRHTLIGSIRVDGDVIGVGYLVIPVVFRRMQGAYWLGVCRRGMLLLCSSIVSGT